MGASSEAGGASVYVVTDDGEILSSAEAAVLALRKSAGTSVEKASRALRADKDEKREEEGHGDQGLRPIWLAR